jgi:hypothetical protein
VEAAEWAVAPAPTVWAEYLCEVRQVEAVLMQPAGQALPGICARVLHPILPVRVESASEFEVPVSMLVARLYSSCVPLCLTTGTVQRLQAVREKADFRDGRQSFNDSTI